MNKPSAVSLSVLFVTVLTLGMIPNVFARTVWTKQPPFPYAYANAWRGDHWPERETWWARASADESTGVMESNIHAYMDVAGYLNVHFETAMVDFVTISSSGTLFITGVVFLKGHAHIYGMALLFGAYDVGYSLDLWLIVDDVTTGTNLLNWKVNTWEDHEMGAPTWITDRWYDFNFDYTIPQTSVTVENGHTYKVKVKLAGQVYAVTTGIAAAQSDMDFESGDFQMKLKWLTYDAPESSYYTLTIAAGSGGTTSPAPGTYEYAEGTPVTVTALPRPGFTFKYWVLDGTTKYGNPITVTMNSDHVLKAYFKEKYCPILFVWNGTDYDEEGLLNIHDPDGIDLVYNHTLITEPAWAKGRYQFRLVEHQKTHSYIDQVKLYATLEDGTEIELPLTYGWHSEHGNLLPQLLFSDEWKTDILGADLNNGTSQSIDLKFQALPPNLQVVSFIFQIEGNNKLPK